MEAIAQPENKNVRIPDTRWNRYWLLKRHLRGTPRPQILPIAGNNEKDIEVAGYIPEQVWPGRHEQIRRVNTPDGIAPTIPTGTGGGVMTKIVAMRGRGEDNIQTLEPRADGNTNTLTSVQKDNLVSTDMAVRRLTPLECERLQGFPDVESQGIIKLCSDQVKTFVNVVAKNPKLLKLVGDVGSSNWKETVKYAEQNFSTKNQLTKRLVVESVHIDSEEEKVVLRTQEKLKSSVGDVGESSWSAQRIETENFAHLLALMNQTLEKTTILGKAESQASELDLRTTRSGKNCESWCGNEIMRLVSDAVNDSTTLSQFMKSIISRRSDIKDIDCWIAMSFFCVMIAIIGFIPLKTLRADILEFHINVKHGWTKYGKDGELMSDSRRYKMCGNAVTVNVIQAVFERIFACE